MISFDANVAGDEKQFQWVRGQLDGLDRARFTNVIAFCHQAPFSSGPHGAAITEAQTTTLRAKYMPLFRAHHVRAVFSGHEHLFEHFVERYTDAAGPHRMDLVVTGGGGAPLYTYQGEPDLREYLKAGESSKVSVEHLAKPGMERGASPYHFLVIRVDGEVLDLEVVGVDWGVGFQPYRSNKVELKDPGAKIDRADSAAAQSEPGNGHAMHGVVRMLGGTKSAGRLQIAIDEDAHDARGRAE